MNDRETHDGYLTIRRATQNGCLIVVAAIIIAWGVLAIAFFAVQRLIIQ